MGKAYVSDSETRLSSQGKVLVEIEPKYYIIDEIKMDKSRENVNTELVNLGKLWITRDINEPKDALYVSTDLPDEPPAQNWDYLGARLDYSVPVSQYWGHVPGAIRGLDTESHLMNSTVKFAWGTHWTGDISAHVDVGVELQPATKILAVVQGVMKKGDTPCTATLTQVYHDAVKKHVQIQTNLKHT